MAAIVHLIGFPASGKYTVAKAICELGASRGQRFVLLDNHLTGNVVLSVIDKGAGDVVPSVAWDRVAEVREVLYRSIEELSPPEWSFVFTNVLLRRDPKDAATLERIAHLAACSGRTFLPVRLRCDLDVLLERTPHGGRAERHKLTVPDTVRTLVQSTDLVDLDEHEPLDVDTTHRSPEDAARLVLDHLLALETPSV